MGKGSAIPFKREDALLAWARNVFARQEAGLGQMPKDDVFDALPQAEKFAWQLTFDFLAMDFNGKRDDLWKGRVSPLADAAHALCLEIENLPAGEQQTKVSLLASQLSSAIKSIIPL